MRNLFTLFFITVLAVLILMGDISFAQGTRFNDPLTVQGLDKSLNYSAVSRALGGTTIGMQNDASLMFSNPAGLLGLQSFQLSVGNTYWTLKESQTQQYGPAKYYANFSLLMEGLTYLVPNTVLDTNAHTARDSVQRPFDKIGPNWDRSKNKNLPAEIMAAMPFTIGEYKIVAGLGAVQYSNMNFYYQNNNVLSPAVNIQRPYPVRLVTNDSSSLPVQWYQNIRDRQGSLYGYGGALSFGIGDNLSLGVRALLIKGSTDDFESQLGRGKLTFYTAYFRVDSVDYKYTKTGTSDYSGTEFNISGMYKSGSLTVGFSIKPPVTITRDYNYISHRDSSGLSQDNNVSGTDKITIPWSGSFGMSIAVSEKLRGVIEYELKPMNNAKYESGGVTTNPWKSANLLHLGAEYNPLDWLTLRAGYSDMAEVFEQEGNPFASEPVYSTILSGGVGLKWEFLKLNITYEYLKVKYSDLLQDAVFLNNSTNSFISADISYNINLPWLR